MREVQTKLAELDLYHGAIDGIAGPMTIEAIKKFQRLHPPMKVDGIAGEKTKNKLFLTSLRTDKTEEEYINSLYGLPGRNIVDFVLPYRMRLAWDANIRINTFQCNAKIVPNLDAIFRQTLNAYGAGNIADYRLDLFGGCFNIRPKRGGKELSTHAWGIAVDIDPANNQLLFHRERATLAGKEYDKFWSIVEANGGHSLGREKNYDWMHFQFLKIGS